VGICCLQDNFVLLNPLTDVFTAMFAVITNYIKWTQHSCFVKSLLLAPLHHNLILFNLSPNIEVYFSPKVNASLLQAVSEMDLAEVDLAEADKRPWNLNSRMA
jgi:hypothetical protein